MAVATSYTGTPNSSNSGGGGPFDHTGLTISAGSNLYLVAFLFTFTSSTTGLSLVWDPSGANQSMTQIGSLDHNASAYGHCIAFGLVNPVTGNKTLRGNWTGGGYCTIAGIAFSGVNPSTPVVTPTDDQIFSSTTASPSITVTSGASDATIAMVHTASTTVTSVDTFTEIWKESALGSMGSYHLGGSSNAHNFTMGSSTLVGGFGFHLLAANDGSLMGQRTFRRHSR